MKNVISLILILACTATVSAQQFNLYNSRTLYDVFENPSQSAYQIDTSRRIAFNFFIPTISVNATASGSADQALKALMYNGRVNAEDIPIGEGKMNTIAFNTNNYIAMLRVLHKVKKSQEVGLSWQVRNDGRMRITNETIAVFDDLDLFNNTTSASGFFDNKGYNQSYHQFSLSYRQDVTKRFSLGAKGSLISGITYTAFNVQESKLINDLVNNSINVSMVGRLRSSFKFDNIDTVSLKPNFKNPGMSLTAGASYKLRNGWFVMGNLKDIGFIKWNKNSYEYDFDASGIEIDNPSSPSADNRLTDSVDQRVSNSVRKRSYMSLLNGKAEVLINKNFGNYQPNLIISKSIFYEGADIVLTNNYHYRNLVLTASADYNTSSYLAIGGQIMVKSPNAEFFLGSDHLFKSIEMIKDARNNTPPYTGGYSGASFYMGFGLKFGRVLEHPANANFIPGFNEPGGRKFFDRIIKKKGN
ncbi:MAG: DUF5723 family protein [Daejeonella sp.]|uniref:DUF5723 family protein n=1 Tax=Daejeonella sp. TaxID=2805397 RepID=UPI003C793CDD